jgi:CheY-like chemotaxis protein
VTDVPSKKYAVLIADDSEDDSFFLERALRQSKHFQVVGAVPDGRDAIAYLAGEGMYADRQLWPLPDVLLVDLHMPDMDGLAVLEWRQQQNFPDLKVVILSGSNIAGDIQKVQKLGADAFYVKSAEHGQLLELIANLEAFLLASGPNGEVQIPLSEGRREG